MSYTHIIFLNFFKNNFLQKNFWALFHTPGGYCPTFSNSPSHSTYPQMFSHLSTSILRLREAVDTYLQRHTYTKTYYVTPTLSSTFHKVSNLNYLLFFFQKIQKFFGPLPPAPGDHDPHFRNPNLTLNTLKFFPTSPPQFYAYRGAVDTYLQRHPYATTSTATPTPKPGMDDAVLLLAARNCYI